jgi:hypothetical protein
MICVGGKKKKKKVVVVVVLYDKRYHGHVFYFSVLQ